ncbi:MAG: F0F1 ATP synthase subunit epsilon [Candidatus Spechtbacteria bacterium]|nr:F0F1 ATP synthase subunit epsilon [Candidatus Spechtbacteria bacterium]
MHLTILNLNETLYDGEASGITAPGTVGEFTVLPHHIDLLTSLKKGVITVHTKGVEKTYIEAPRGGIFELAGEKATILL